MVPGIRTDNKVSDAMATKPKVKVAVIGTGLAGLHANYLLQQSDEYDVHLFEQNDTFGLDASSITTSDGVRIDVPMRSINSGYYPNLMRLYRSLGVRLRKSDFTFSFAVHHTPDQPFLLYNGMSGLRGISLPDTSNDTATNHVRNARHSYGRRMIGYVVHARLCLSFVTSYVCLLFLALYHHALGHLSDPQHPLSSEPLSRWTRRHTRALHPAFVHAVLFSLFSAVGTSSYEAVAGMPTAELLLYVAVTFLRSHYVVQDGVQAVQLALTNGVRKSNVHLASAVERIEHDPVTGCARICYRSTVDGRELNISNFDHVILACPANLSASLLQTYEGSLSKQQRSSSASNVLQNIIAMHQALSQIRYERSLVLNHTDTKLLPRNAANRRDLNIVCPSQSTHDPFDKESKQTSEYSSSTATHIVHSAGTDKIVLQTTNPNSIRPDEKKIISQATFSRAMTPASKTTLQGLFEWRASKLSLLQRFNMALFAPSALRQPMALQSDWISRYLETLFGRKRWTQSLGTLHESQLQRPRGLHHVNVSFWACGSYAHGIPLLEGCITSSTLVVDGIHRQKNRWDTSG